eukprot:TRINITY_DN13780_c0_g1_i1.p1 TRINITY_DN13780_c0_g1~~TRINITY_DN13780_c0_g1_i1.p1  ORF type:complete len:229 (-),score=89.94 TRINITY_DN13780_c0_g1_i1:852-1538(-)
MADSWEDEDFEPQAPVVAQPVVKGQWDDEDVEEDTAKESWEDDEVKPPAAPAPTAKPKVEKKKSGKGKEVVNAPAEDNGKLSDPVAEKLRMQRIVEEADLASTKELFKSEGKESKSLDDFIPKSETDFIEYGRLVAAKITPYQKNFPYMAMLKELLKNVTNDMDSVSVKELSSALTVTLNAKLKAEKDALGGKKKSGPKKTQLKVDKPDDDDMRLGGGAYDNDDYDFM